MTESPDDTSFLTNVAVISVTYNSAAVLPAMLASLPDGIETIIVDNASNDDSANIASQAGITVVPMESNLGFGTACNAGAAVTQAKWLFFLNPDAQLQADVRSFFEQAEAQDNAAAFNPRIVDSKGRERIRMRSVIAKGGCEIINAEDGVMSVPVLSGSALIVSREKFEAVGGFDEQIFLYHEDDDLSLRLSQKFGPLLRLSSLTVLHAGDESVAHSKEGRAFKCYHEAKSRRYVMEKHVGGFSHLRTLIKAAARVLRIGSLFDAQCRAEAVAYWKGATGRDL